jgi:hypothetical protein
LSLRGAEGDRGNPVKDMKTGLLRFARNDDYGDPYALGPVAWMLASRRMRRRPPAPTAEESEQLNEVEELLNEEAAKEEGPEDRSPGPSD